MSKDRLNSVMKLMGGGGGFSKSAEFLEQLGDHHLVSDSAGVT
jgi:hypothetical protein